MLLLAAPLLLAIVVMRWLHLRFIRPLGWVVDSALLQWEEYLKSVLREWTHEASRLLNAGSALVLSVFSRRSYFRTSRGKGAGAVGAAWQEWWAGASSTFNALLEREGLSRASSEPDGTAAPEAQLPQRGQVRRRRGPLGWLRGRPAPPAPAARRPVPLTRGSALFGLPSGFAVAESLAGRRGLLEDWRFRAEVVMTRVFGFVRRCVRLLLLLPDQAPASSMPGSPRAGGGGDQRKRRSYSGGGGFSGSFKPRPEQSDGRWEDLGTWTASDAILAAGYPLEEHTITTSDGYILTLHRIPRGAKDCVFFQHGVFDSSLGWVANGSVGSQAFAAWDAGFDVFLANSRSNPPRRHTDKRRSGARYWAYSVNELAASDIAAAINHIHNLKLAELQVTAQPAREPAEQGSLRRVASDSALQAMRRIDVRTAGERTPRKRRGGSASEDEAAWGMDVDAAPATLARSQSAGELSTQAQRAREDSWADGPGPASARWDGTPPGKKKSRPQRMPRSDSCSSGGGGEVLPYRLQAVGHSLGAASLLQYVVLCRMRGQPQRIRRLILMSPAGFHTKVPLAMRPLVYLMPLLAWVVGLFRPGAGIGLRLPSPLLRHICFKLALDMRLVPALQDLVSAALRFLASGDESQWLAAARLPHYSAASMPALSLRCAAQFGQWARDPNFRLFDYGSKRANRRHYGADKPPSIADHYHLLQDLAVDIIAGSGDGVIPAADVQRHYARLTAAGVPASFRVFECSHLDLTFAVLDEVRTYILAQLAKPAL